MDKETNTLAKLLAVYVPFSVASTLGSGLVYLYFKSAGVSDLDLVASFIFYFIAPLLVILALNNRKTGSRTLMWLGLAAGIAAYALVALLPPSKEVLFAYSFLIGTICFLFWVPFNAMYFGISRGRAASLGTIYFSVGPVLSLVLPLIAATIAQDMGFGTLFLASAALYVIPMIAAVMLADSAHSYELKACIDELIGFKTLVLIEGIYGGGISAAIAVVSLFYFTSPMEMGTFLSVTTVFAVIASVIISKLSDKSRRRMEYIKLFGSGLGLVTFLGGLATNAMAWYGAMSGRNFFASLFWPFTTAIIVDNKRDMAKSMVSREFMLNVGRIIGVGIVLFCALFLDIYLSLAILGICIMAYPLVIELKKRNIKVE
ncbi:hypothetical protein H0O00_05165 [Candidatus Micrarchaeota archaeon]|nr:hypothetical protein [Candidatus Micrarchaeota archaeon]